MHYLAQKSHRARSLARTAATVPTCRIQGRIHMYTEQCTQLGREIWVNTLADVKRCALRVAPCARVSLRRPIALSRSTAATMPIAMATPTEVSRRQQPSRSCFAFACAFAATGCLLAARLAVAKLAAAARTIERVRSDCEQSCELRARAGQIGFVVGAAVEPSGASFRAVSGKRALRQHFHQRSVHELRRPGRRDQHRLAQRARQSDRSRDSQTDRQTDRQIGR